MVVETKSPEQTRRFGQKLGRLLKAGDVVCLYGALGSGKTTLTQGAAKGAGFSGRVVSPTFGLVRVYRGRKLILYHLDLYRVAESETGDIGIEDYVRDPKAACLIEWPQAAEPFLPKERLDIRLSHAPGGGRVLRLRAHGSRARCLAVGLK